MSKDKELRGCESLSREASSCLTGAIFPSIARACYFFSDPELRKLRCFLVSHTEKVTELEWDPRCFCHPKS